MTTRQLILFAVILFTYLIAGVLFATLTPPWQAPDEPAHYNYIRYLGTHTDFPELVAGCYNQDYLSRLTAQRFPPQLPIDTICYEFHQPPLYYLLATPFYLLGDGSLTVLRLVSVVLGAGVVILAFFVANTIFPKNLALTGGTMALVAFVPMHTAILASVNNDALAELLLAGVLLLLARRMTAATPPTVAQDIILGVMLGLGLVTKTTVYIAVVLVGVAVLLPVLGSKITIRKFAGQVALIFGLALLIAAPWYLRNAGLYGSLDVLGLTRHNEVVVGQLRTTSYLAEVGAVAYARNFGLTTFKSFWGQFGWMAVPMDTRTYRLLLALAGIAGAGLTAFLVQQWRGSPNRQFELSTAQWQALGLLALTVALVLVAYSGYNLSFVQFQGRYLFPGLIPLSLFLSLGLSEACRPRWTWWLVGGLALVLLWLLLRSGLDKRAALLLLAFAGAAAARKIWPALAEPLSVGLLAACYVALAGLTLLSPYWFVLPYL